MLSKGGFVFGIINIIGNFGTPSPSCAAPAEALPSCTEYAAVSPAALSCRSDAWRQKSAEEGASRLRLEQIAPMDLIVSDQMPVSLQALCTMTR